MNHLKSKSGFTLIELLVVISIIGLLSSIILASVQNARDKGNVSAGLRFGDYNYHSLGSEAYGYWDFTEGTAGTSASNVIDKSGNGRNFNSTSANGSNGISATAPTYDVNTPLSVKGLSLKFTASGALEWENTGSASIPMDGSSDYTLSAWVNTSVAGTSAYIMSIRTGGGSLLASMLLASGKPTCNHQGSNTVTSVSQLAVGKWYLVTCAFSRATQNATLYVNGAIDSRGNHAVSWNTQFDGILVGQSIAGTFKWNGYLDDVGFFNQAITASEAYKMYAEGVDKHKNLAQN